MTAATSPKLRMLAGPNGSGKSTLFRYLRDTFAFPFGYWLNPDEIDRELVRTGRLYVGGWGLRLDQKKLTNFVGRHGLAPRLSGDQPRVEDGGLVVGKRYRPGYFASVFADFLRREWMAKGESFTFETVMSHPDRLRSLRDGLRRGYRTYLYYICTDDPLINAGRIESRVKQGGHAVPAAAVADRYVRSLALLPRAIDVSSRAYLFDNSEKEHRLVAEYEAGELIRMADDPPGWFIDSVLTARRDSRPNPLTQSQAVPKRRRRRR